MGVSKSLSPGKVKILGHSVHSFREPRPYLTMPRSAQVHFLLSISARGREEGKSGTGALHRLLEIGLIGHVASFGRDSRMGRFSVQSGMLRGESRLLRVN